MLLVTIVQQDNILHHKVNVICVVAVIIHLRIEGDVSYKLVHSDNFWVVMQNVLDAQKVITG